MNRYAPFFAAFKELRSAGFNLDRSELIFEFTEGRTNSLKDLSQAEVNELIRYIKKELFKLRDPDKGKSDFIKGDVMRKRIISIFHKLGYQEPNGKIDMNTVNKWCVKYGYLHKPLNSYKYKELPKLVSQAENIETKFINLL